MFETLDRLVFDERAPVEGDGRSSPTPEEAAQNTVKAIGKGLLKTISKMGISTIQSYCGAQIFEAVGLERGADRPALHRHRLADRRGRPGGARAPRRSSATRARRPRPEPRPSELLPVGGVYAWRRDGEHHMWNPETIALLQHAVRARTATRQAYEEFARASVDEQATRPAHACAACCDRSAGAPRTRSRSSRSSRRRRSSSASHRRDEPRLDLARGARDARDRDEPARRRIEHGRGRRGPGALYAATRTATAAARRSSRSPRDASA